jgi:hypothetical protein
VACINVERRRRRRIRRSMRLHAIRDPLLIFLSLISVALSGSIWAYQYLVIGLFKLGFSGFLLSLWHVIALTIFVFYIDYRRSKQYLGWKYDAKPITSKTIQEFVDFINDKEQTARQ